MEIKLKLQCIPISHIYAPVSLIKIICTVQELYRLHKGFAGRMPIGHANAQLYNFYISIFVCYMYLCEMIFATFCLYFMHIDFGYECIVFSYIITRSLTYNDTPQTNVYPEFSTMLMAKYAHSQVQTHWIKITCFNVQLRIQDMHSNVCVVECTIAGRFQALTCRW